MKKYGKVEKECFVTVDPIDGTSNLMHGLPFYACSIAVSDTRLLESVYAGLVVDIYHDVTYVALKGKGAFCDGKKISTSKTASLDDAMVGLDLNTYKKRCCSQTNNPH